MPVCASLRKCWFFHAWWFVVCWSLYLWLLLALSHQSSLSLVFVRLGPCGGLDGLVGVAAAHSSRPSSTWISRRRTTLLAAFPCMRKVATERARGREVSWLFILVVAPGVPGCVTGLLTVWHLENTSTVAAASSPLHTGRNWEALVLFCPSNSSRFCSSDDSLSCFLGFLGMWYLVSMEEEW